MRKTSMLALASIRKNKGQTFSLLILLVVAGALLYLGLTLTLNTGNFFDKKAKEMNAADIVVTLQDTIFSEADIAYFRDNLKVQSLETVETLVLPTPKIEYAGGVLAQSITFIDEQKLGGMLSPCFVGENLPAEPDSIYLPYIFQAGGGFDIGDTITIEYNAEKFTFKIAGFFEDVNFGYISGGNLGMILPDYDGFVSRLDAPVLCSTLLVRVFDKKDAEIYRDFSFDKVLSTDPALLNASYKNGIYYEENKQYNTMTMNLMSVIIILFSILIVVVALIVVQFRITNSIEDDMVNTGSLKAAGFTSGQIINGILTQFLIISFTGCGLGIMAAIAISPMLSSAFASQNGLIWDVSFDIFAVILTITLIAASSLLTSLWASRRVRALTPIVALRGGITTHSFKKNRFQLDKAKGGLGFLLALKAIKMKQSVSIALICAAVTFASLVAMILYYNVGVNDTAFINVVVAEYCDAAVFLSNEADARQILEGIRNMEGVKNAVPYHYIGTAQVERSFIQPYITEDFDDLTGGFIYEGRSPKHNNEVAIGGSMAEELGKSIGDKILITFQGGTAEYFICGLGQVTNYNGWAAQLTIDGARRMNPDYRPHAINIYFEKDTGIDDLCERLRSKLDVSISELIKMDDTRASLDTYINLFFIIAVAIVCVTVLVIALVLYLIIKTSILRRRRMLGIQKAVGFTTGQLMRQIALSFMPPVVVGVCLGGVLGGTCANLVFSTLFKSIGIMRTDFIVVPALIIATGAVIGMFAYLVAMTVSWRIRKISAYALVSE